MTVGVLVIDDQEVVRLGLAELLRGSSLELVAEASTVDVALRLLDNQAIQVALVDVRLAGGEDGLAGLGRLKHARPSLPVVMFSAFENPTFVARAFALGAAGFLPKAMPRDEMVAALEQAAQKQILWRRDQLRRVSSALAAARIDQQIEAPLTQREGEVLRHVCSGRTNQQIAELLGISYETVKEHVQHLLEKIGVTDRTQAAIWAVRAGLA